MEPSLPFGHAVLALLLCGASCVTSAADYYLAGRELSPGAERNGTTYGVLFAGWTLDSPGWASAGQSTGGAWTTIIARAGNAGFGSHVAITGDGWTLRKSDGSTLGGRVIDGMVVWPASHDSTVSDLPAASIPDADLLTPACGNGVAAVKAEVSLDTRSGAPGQVTGTMLGCLDDQEWLNPSDTFRLPPRIWVTLSVPG